MGKAEMFTLKGMNQSAVAAAAALLAGVLMSKGKLRVEFAVTGEGDRIVKNIRAHS